MNNKKKYDGLPLRTLSGNLTKKITKQTSLELASVIAKVGDTQGNLWVENRPGYIHARGFDGLYYQAYSEIKDLQIDQLVRIGNTSSNRKVFKVLEVWSSQSRPIHRPLELHGDEHSLGGRDVTPIWMGQFMWWNAQPIEETLTVQVYCPARRDDSGLILPPSIEVLDLSSYAPPGGLGALYVLIEVLNGALNLVPGSAATSKTTLALSDIPDSSPGAFRLAAFAIYGQSVWAISNEWSDFIDLRLSDYSYITPSWSDIIGIPSEFEPGPGSSYYVNRYVFTSDPTLTDDNSAGYQVGDEWVNSVSLTVFWLLDDTSGAAVWQEMGSGSGGGGSSINWMIEGALSTIDPVPVNNLIDQDISLFYLYLYLGDTGSAGTTEVDLYLEGGSSVLSAPLQIDYDATDKWAKIDLTVTDFVEGDVLCLALNSVATGASDLRAFVQGAVTGGGGGPTEVPSAYKTFLRYTFR